LLLDAYKVCVFIWTVQVNAKGIGLVQTGTGTAQGVDGFKTPGDTPFNCLNIELDLTLH